VSLARKRPVYRLHTEPRSRESTQKSTQIAQLLTDHTCLHAGQSKNTVWPSSAERSCMV